MIQINGKETDLTEVLLATYLEEHGYKRERIAVECNEKIVPKAQYDTFLLKDGDIVEIVSFVGGGGKNS